LGRKMTLTDIINKRIMGKIKYTLRNINDDQKLIYLDEIEKQIFEYKIELRKKQWEEYQQKKNED